MLNWVNNTVKKFKCKNIIISGGVAQNIKLIKYLNDKSIAKKYGLDQFLAMDRLQLELAGLNLKKQILKKILKV